MNNIYFSLKLAYASAKSFKEQGYELIMYTDSLGSRLLKGFPYDDIVVLEMPEDINPTMFSVIKYKALEKEPIGSIHCDFDVFITSPCISLDDDYDLIVQCEEGEMPYSRERRFFANEGYIEKYDYFLEPIFPYCVGVVGFNNRKLWESFYTDYMDIVNHYKTTNFPKNCTIELLMEQVLLPHLCKENNYKVKFVCNDQEYIYLSDHKHRYAVGPGFIHYHGKSKYTEQIQKEINSKLSSDEIALINKNFNEYLWEK